MCHHQIVLFPFSSSRPYALLFWEDSGDLGSLLCRVSEHIRRTSECVPEENQEAKILEKGPGRIRREVTRQRVRMGLINENMKGAEISHGNPGQVHLVKLFGYPCKFLPLTVEIAKCVGLY